MLGWFVVHPDNRFHIKRGDSVSLKSVVQFGNSGINSVLSASFAAMFFRDGVTDLEARRLLNWFTSITSAVTVVP
jgi:hypothetical protein